MTCYEAGPLDKDPPHISLRRTKQCPPSPSGWDWARVLSTGTVRAAPGSELGIDPSGLGWCGEVLALHLRAGQPVLRG